jgi:hypothetical protein
VLDFGLGNQIDSRDIARGENKEYPDLVVRPVEREGSPIERETKGM